MEKFVASHLKLIELERTAEIEETRVLTEKLPPKELQRRGVCLLKLRISGRKTGLYGRTILFFEAAGGIKEFPSHSITSGDIVGLCQTSGDPSTDSIGSGIVTKVTQTEVGVAYDDGQDLSEVEDDASYKLTKLANDVTYKRIKDALNRLSQSHSLPCSNLASVLFQESELSPPFDKQDIHFVNTNLDESQREAVKFALCQPEVAVVHGPPGTGKTTTVIEIIIQAVKQGKKVLACAPSNIAVDNLVERLAANKQKIVRLGHPARVLHHIQKYSLDAILSTSNETRLVEDVRSDMDKAMAKMKKTRDRGERQRFREDLKSLKKELIQREQTAIKQILNKADVVLATMTGASGNGPLKFLDEKHFDLGIVDECSQAIEAACWIPLLRVPRCILAGDHLQLPPTILSNEAAKTGLELTLMERILGIYGNKVMRMLTTQYRMNHMIMQWSSDQLYDGKLVAHPSVSQHLLSDLSGIDDNEDTSQPLLLVDTAGCELYELDLPEEISKGNEGEADIVSNHVEKLISYGLKQEDIAVIAPYNLQVELLRLRLHSNFPKVEVKSVDGFQGREKEAVLISLVRSNPKGEVGFLAERRRINVAITRARRHLMVVCDSETVGHDKFLQSLVDYMTANGDVQTAHQYIEDGIANAKLVRPDHLNDLLSIKTATQKGQGAKPKQKLKPKQTERTQNQKQNREKETGSRRQNDKFTDEEMLKKKTDEYQEHLNKFVANTSQDIIDFPTSLNSYDRLIIHELSEKMGLIHVSRGENKERHLVVSKPGVKVTKESKEEVELMESKEKLEVNNVDTKDLKKDNDKIVCKYCSKDVIKANFALHELHCLRKQKEASQAGNSSKNRKDSAKNRTDNPQRSASGKKQTAVKDVMSKLQNVDPDDFDALISATQEMDSKCMYQKCKVKTITLGHTCQFCIKRFCLNHSMPEVHGCGDAIKAQARATIVKDGVLYRGSGVPSKLPDPKKKALLERKMEKKLTEMEAERQKKKKKK